MKNPKRVKELHDMIFKAKDSYYNDGESIMTDEEYDKACDELRILDSKNEALTTVGAPLKKVTEWKKASHTISMTSQNKVNSEQEFREWAAKTGAKYFVAEDKLDGFSIEGVFGVGTLTQAITRGEGGLIGEDIYANVKHMKGMVTKLPEPLSCSVHGETFILVDDFEEMNKILKSENKKQLANPRNGATGTAKRFDGRFSEYLSVFFYDLESPRLDFATEVEKMDYLKKLGFPVCFYKRGTVDDMVEIFKQYEKELRVKTPYDIDGLVIKVDDIKLQKQLGIVGGCPKGQIAWKFEAVKVETIAEEIEWGNGRNRRITPVANVQGVRAGGVVIRNATLHNLDIFNKLKIGRGDTVQISRRNDVIPYLEKVLVSKGDFFKVPSKCPTCGADTEIEGAFLICPNDACPALATGNLEKWVVSLNIMDVGEKLIDALFEAGKVKEPADFYKLKTSDISSLERMGERSATKVLTHFNEKKEVTLPEFIAGLNIHQFATGTAEALVVAGLDTIEKMQKATVSELVSIKGIGDKTAECIVKGLSIKAKFIQNLLDAGITFKKPVEIVAKGNQLAGISFCFTGAIQRLDEKGERFTRKMMQTLVIENGGKVEDGVKKGLSFLVMADPNSVSDKTKKAKELGVNILSEEDFFKKIGM